MLDTVLFYLPLTVALIGLLLTSALALWSFRRRRLAWLAFGLASLGAQVTSALQYASAFVSMAAQAARPRPMDRHPHSVEFLPPRVLVIVAWSCWVLAVVRLARAARMAEPAESRSWRRPALGLVLVACAIAMLQRVDARLDELVDESRRALFEGTSRLAYRPAEEPEDVDALASIPVRRIELGHRGGGVVGVAVDRDGRVFQWNAYARHAPAEAISLPGSFDAAFADERHACGITTDGHASCAPFPSWTGTLGVAKRLGDGPVTLLAPAPDIEDSSRICGLLADGTARCWGSRTEGDLEETQGLPFGAGLRAMTPAFGYVGCAAGQDGHARCWRLQSKGEVLGGEVAGLEDVIALSSSTERACAIDRKNAVACWELEPARGRVGWTALPVAGLRAVQVSVAPTHTCAVTVEGKVACWGSNPWGELCDGTTDDHTQPVTAVGVSDAVMVSTQVGTTCILRASGAVACCGQQRRFD